MDASKLADSSDPHVRNGYAVRREVLGEDYVDNALATTTPLGEDVQELVTGQVWGAQWGRPALDWPSRSLITIALLTAGGHQNELRAHIVGGLRNGLTQDQILEVIRHCAGYCGAPVALSAMRTAQDVLASVGAIDDERP